MLKRLLLCFALTLLATCLRAQSLPDAPLAIGSPCPADCGYTSGAELPHARTIDKKFIAIHALYAGALIFDEKATLWGEDKGCAYESGQVGAYRASLGDLAKTEWPFFAGIAVADYFLKRHHVRFAWFVMPAIGAGKHLDGAIKWEKLCR